MLLKKTHLVEVSSSLLLWPLKMRNLTSGKISSLRRLSPLPNGEATSSTGICLPCPPFPSVLFELVPAKRKTQTWDKMNAIVG